MGRARSDSREDRNRKSRDRSKGGRHRKRRHRSSSTSSSSSSSSSDSASSSRRRNQGSRRRRSRSKSYERSRRRSRSRSYDRPRSRKSRSRSREKHRSNTNRKDKKNEPTISLDSKAAEFKEETVLTIEEQITRIQAMEEIQSEGFIPQSFMSTRSNKPTVAVMTELGGTVKFADQSANIAVLDKGGLCHPKLFMNQAEKEDRWLRKLFEMRQKILREDPTVDV